MIKVFPLCYNHKMKSFEQIIDELKNEYSANPNIHAFLITGSYARGEAHVGNDLDIILVTNGEKISKEYREGDSLIEIGSIVLPQALNDIEKNPMQVYMYLDAKAVFDTNNSLEALQLEAQEVLKNYKPSTEEKKLLKKWLSSVVDKIRVAQRTGDTLKVGFHTSNVLWKLVEGIYLISSVPVPASTSALRKITDLQLLPQDFDTVWKNILLGSLEERSSGTLQLLDFILSKIDVSTSDLS